MKIKINGRALVIETEMTPLKSINQRYASNTAFVFESGATQLSSKLDSKVRDHQLQPGMVVTDEFSIAWTVLQLGRQISRKVCKNHD